MLKLALFSSGSGSNVQAILESIDKGVLHARAVCLICDQPKAPVLERAKKYGLPTYLCSPSTYSSREDWETAIQTIMQQYEVDYIVLAGFMRILGKVLLDAYPNRILNIHPSYLPAFPGRKSIQDAYEAGVTETGVTVFYVDAGIDTGQIIRQEKVQVHPDWTMDELEAAIHQVEHRLYTEVLQAICQEERRRRVFAPY